MKFLADMGVSGATAKALREMGHDVVHLREVGLSRLPDPQIFSKARTEGRVVLTFDLDFSDLVAASGEALPSVITFKDTPQIIPGFRAVEFVRGIRDRHAAALQGKTAAERLAIYRGNASAD